MQDADLVGGTHGARLQGRVHPDGPVDDPGQLLPRLVQPVGGGLDRADQLRGQRDGPRVGRLGEGLGSERGPREEFAPGRRHQRGQDGQRHPSPPRPVHRESHERAAGQPDQEDADGQRSHLPMDRLLDGGDQAFDPALPEGVRELSELDVLERGREGDRAGVRVGREQAERGEHDPGDAGPEVGGHADVERPQPGLRAPGHDQAEPRSGQADQDRYGPSRDPVQAGAGSGRQPHHPSHDLAERARTLAPPSGPPTRERSVEALSSGEGRGCLEGFEGGHGGRR